MPEILFVSKKLNNAALVWFEKSNLYIQMEEPAWFVFRKILKRYKTETIAGLFSERYGVAANESLKFTREIRERINSLNQPESDENKVAQYAFLETYEYAPSSVFHYKPGTKMIRFSYESPRFENYLHHLISHFQTGETGTVSDHFELFAYENLIVFRFNGKIKGVWNNDESHLVKGMIFMHLINVMYDKSDDDWLMTVHASAISNGKKTILFSAPPNKGKTTMAALLQSNGYQLISDDFVPVARNSFEAYPFPIAMSVKQTSMEVLAPLYPQLEEKPLKYISPEKSVRFLGHSADSDLSEWIFPVHEFVFIEYNKNVDFDWEKLNSISAAKLLLDQTWVIPSRSNAEFFMEKLAETDFYKLTYSNNQKALQAIANLFEDDK